MQPQYYAAIVAGEAIGSSGDTQSTEIVINNSRVSGYAFFDGGKLARAVFINSEAFFAGSSTPRTSVHLNFTFDGANAPTTITVKRLAIG